VGVLTLSFKGGKGWEPCTAAVKVASGVIVEKKINVDSLI